MRLLSFLCLLLSLSFVSAQTLDHRQGELIVRLGADVDATKFWSARGEISHVETLSADLNIFLVHFDHDRIAGSQFRRQLWHLPAVRAAQPNHLLHPRARPNDPRYDLQWQHRNTGQRVGGLNGLAGADHNPEPAWDIATGGVTANGDTIVIAIIDDGVDTDHEDLLPNLWVNRGEIPGNGVDDDNNGYVDDIYGYSVADNTGNVESNANATHGTAVTGLVGARGNNGLGVSGANWNIKLMIVRNNLVSTESSAIAAYAYPLAAKRRYLDTDGAEGAYVVATNASWGRDFGTPEESPIWCGLYDDLGELGILSAGAAPNLDVNVDEMGDLPTNCPSDYLIGVTNLLADNEKKRDAGFGSTSVDLGAFGEGVYTTITGNTYGDFDGTSAATPSVAGAIGLLFAAPCDNFAELLVADPPLAALRVRAALLNNVTPNASLSGITVTGGRLNIGAAMLELMANGADPNGTSNSACDACVPPTTFTATPTRGTATSLTLDWRATASLSTVNLRYRVTGASAWTEVANVSAPYQLSGLSACVNYDVQLTGNCGGAEVSTEVTSLSTDGCCVIPEDFAVTARNGFFQATWTPLLAASFYRVRYRPAGTETWTTRTSAGGGINLAGNLLDCTDYEFELLTDCDTLQVGFGGRLNVVSTGCGSCNEANYCLPDDFDNSREWISKVELGNGIFTNNTGAETGGYASFGDLAGRDLVRGGVYPLELRARSATETQLHEFKVYADWNQDGFFANGELIAEVTATGNNSVFTTFTVPVEADTLLTRLRVVMEFNNVSGGACAQFTADGEVEDYCISIATPTGCLPPDRLAARFDPASEQTMLSWRASAAVGGSYRIRYRLRDTQDAWVEADAVDTTRLSVDVNLCGAYEVEVASLCGDTPGPYRIFYFNDVCTSGRDLRLASTDWSVFPNPAGERVSVVAPGPTRSLELFDLTGRRLRSWPAMSGGQTELDLGGLPGGVYLLRLWLTDGRLGTRRLVVR